jgi:hypothetical protein
MGVGVPAPVDRKTLFDSVTEFTVRNVALLPAIEMSHPVKLPVVLFAKVSRSIQSRGGGEEVPTGTARFRVPLSTIAARGRLADANAVATEPKEGTEPFELTLGLGE